MYERLASPPRPNHRCTHGSTRENDMMHGQPYMLIIRLFPTCSWWCTGICFPSLGEKWSSLHSPSRRYLLRQGSGKLEKGCEEVILWDEDPNLGLGECIPAWGEGLANDRQLEDKRREHACNWLPMVDRGVLAISTSVQVRPPFFFFFFFFCQMRLFWLFTWSSLQTSFSVIFCPVLKTNTPLQRSCN